MGKKDGRPKVMTRPCNNCGKPYEAKKKVNGYTQFCKICTPLRPWSKNMPYGS